jgi:hypoxanthine phosphoribosyltransferase
MEVKHNVAISADELRQRIAALGQQISKDYQGRVVHCVGVLESGFIFMADLVRAITGEVRCEFVKANTKIFRENTIEVKEIFYTPEVDVSGEHILLCEAILSTGLTTDFLIRHLKARGAASVAVCGLLDRPADRRVEVDVAYYGFRIGPERLAGFGLSAGDHSGDQSNLPYMFNIPAVEA